jgi:hypothetical protein
MRVATAMYGSPPRRVTLTALHGIFGGTATCRANILSLPAAALSDRSYCTDSDRRVAIADLLKNLRDYSTGEADGLISVMYRDNRYCANPGHDGNGAAC